MKIPVGQLSLPTGAFYIMAGYSRFSPVSGRLQDRRYILGRVTVTFYEAIAFVFKVYSEKIADVAVVVDYQDIFVLCHCGTSLICHFDNICRGQILHLHRTSGYVEIFHEKAFFHEGVLKCDEFSAVFQRVTRGAHDTFRKLRREIVERQSGDDAVCLAERVFVKITADIFGVSVYDVYVRLIFKQLFQFIAEQGIALNEKQSCAGVTVYDKLSRE